MKYQLATLFLALSCPLLAQEIRELAWGNPVAVVDLRTAAGCGLVGAQWTTCNAQITPAPLRAPGPSPTDPLPIYPTGRLIGTFALEPRYGTPAFERASWQAVAAADLETRRGAGLLSHVWYRLRVTLPTTLGTVGMAGARVLFEVVADDYSEVWVNGQLRKSFGARANGVIGGYNARQRVWLTDYAKPGDTFDLAILVTNGPLADLPDNYVWIRSATLDVYAKPPVPDAWANLGQVIQVQNELTSVVEPTARLQKVADGFQFIEGPVWHPDGYLLFSDPNANVIYRYDPTMGNVSVYMTKTGYTGIDIGTYHQPGSNGLAIDLSGHLLVCQHGNRRIIRDEIKGPMTVLSNNYAGKKLNSPNDLVVKSNGAIYFTDPPYGLPNAYADPRKETPYAGVYRIYNDHTDLLTTDPGGPNGIAFSPDENYLYVSNWDIRDIHNTKTLWRYAVKPDGTLTDGKVFFDMNQTDDDEALDGIKVDVKGYLFVSGPGGVWVISPEGMYLGKIIGPERPANMAWGDDGKTLYLTAHTGLYKIRTINGGKLAQPARN
ncbi:SMP-30/gluconolactonase/LRE family protein [Fibrella aquatilis]|uniref:SMP-30/gluconolactonase/LRE family protein n=1 Tax=Fibrella aquatilis TaxID=2817059 RepID=A0A939G807_9BACT|nr:SMP-30/gluconolactonase/LRE family protein [Fibrella aquatilis]MBO0932324.1 SMP-30/gluconolactonase/LRE family protein [Fibrella aquatilis]